MMIEKEIYSKIQSYLNPDELEVVNESCMHRGPDNSETHFKIITISCQFENLKSIQRHQLIHKILQETIKKIHALTILAYTPMEWSKIERPIQSPSCAHKKLLI